MKIIKVVLEVEDDADEDIIIALMKGAFEEKRATAIEALHFLIKDIYLGD